jgi:hypothetical protein
LLNNSVSQTTTSNISGNFVSARSLKTELKSLKEQQVPCELVRNPVEDDSAAPDRAEHFGPHRRAIDRPARP